MDESAFQTDDGRPVPAVTAAEMREVDRVAVEEAGLPLVGMMENAGRNLAAVARAMLAGVPLADDTADGGAVGGEGGNDTPAGPVVVLAGGGGNGGGGLACARHLANHGVAVDVVLDRDPDDLEGVPAAQLRAAAAADVAPSVDAGTVADAALVVDALVGYGLERAPRGRVADLVSACDDAAAVLSLDVPTGVDATTGETPGVAVAPDRTLTLALPKVGLDGAGGDLLLGDIAIPAGVYARAGIEYASPFDGRYVVSLVR